MGTLGYKGFLFRKTYDLDVYIPFMYDQLISQFDNRTKSGFFENKGFTLVVGPDADVYERDDYYFLDCEIVFPTSLTYDCTICWHKQDDGSIKFYWTTNFPNEELDDYINGRGLPDDGG